MKDMYISGGLNVYPAEIGNVILKDPRISEAAVIGIEDQKCGEVGCAIIVPREGKKVGAQQIEDLCKEWIAGYKVPKKYVIRGNPLPRTTSGKVKKYGLIGEAKKTG